MIDADVVGTVSEIAVLWIVYQKDIKKIILALNIYLS